MISDETNLKRSAHQEVFFIILTTWIRQTKLYQNNEELFKNTLIRACGTHCGCKGDVSSTYHWYLPSALWSFPSSLPSYQVFSGGDKIYFGNFSSHMSNRDLFVLFLLFSLFDMFLCSSALSFQWRRTLKTSRLIINHLLLLQPPLVFLKTGWFQIGPCPGWLRPPLVFPDVSPYDGCMTVLLQVIMDDDGKTKW